MRLVDFYFPRSFATVWVPRKVEVFINEAKKDCVTQQDLMKKATTFGFEPSWIPLQLQGVPEGYQVFGLSISCDGMGIPLTVLMKIELPNAVTTEREEKA
jgi:hypothetical protein